MSRGWAQAQLPDASAASGAGSPAASGDQTPQNVIDVILSGGVTGIAIILLLVVLSIIALALGVEHLLTIRRGELMPPGLANRIQQLLARGDVSEADKACRAEPCALTSVLHAGLAEVQGGWSAVEKAMEEALAEQSAHLLRKIDYLSVIGNIAPMVGLLGTVCGMIFAFQEVANTQGAARAAELASGIYQALVTTVGGLIIAIPSLAAFAVFRNRIDLLIAETAYLAQQTIAPVKRSFIAGRSVAPPPIVAPDPPPAAGVG
jgi:biopolymer transport protein ExbB